MQIVPEKGKKMKKLLYFIFTLLVIASSCPGQVLVYRITSVEETFDVDFPCADKYRQATGGFIAAEVDLDELVSLKCGESTWTLDTAMVRFGQTGDYRWRCELEPLVRIYRLEGDNYSLSVETFDVNEANDFSDDWFFETLADVNDPNEPNEPNEPDNGFVTEPDGVSNGCFTCFTSGPNAYKLIYLGESRFASVPRAFKGWCTFNGDRIKGSSRCAVVLNRNWTRIANDSGYSPAEIRKKLFNRRLFYFTHLGSCCEPDSPPVDEPDEPAAP